MISLITFSIAAFLNSIMDTLFDHYGSSIFKNKNPNFWNPNISWKNSKTIMGYHIDAWHICKSLMIMLIVASIVLYKPINLIPVNIPYVVDFVIYGIIWNVIFNTFFKVLNKN